MGMTSNEKDIFKLTGLKIGNVYLKDIEFEPQKNNNRILDCSSGNFHLFPKLNDQQCELWKQFFEKERTVREKIIGLLPKKLEKEKDYSIIATRATLIGMPDFYINNQLNQFFRSLQIKIGNRHYTILFKRFYIDKTNQVNCKFGEVQFFTSLDGKINEKKDSKDDIGEIITYAFNRNSIKEKLEKDLKKFIVHYPASYKGQNEKMIKLSGTDNCTNVYNPKNMDNILDSSDLDQYAAQVSDSFIKYIEKIKELSAKS